jgi:hypothetical protein
VSYDVITNSRQLGSLDREITKELSTTKHLTLVDKEEIEKKLLEYNIEQKY